MKKFIKGILSILGLCILVVAIYVAYVFISYYRVEDKTKLSVRQFSNNQQVEVNQVYRIASANLGFGAYSDDYSFFMDGGKYSRAFSEKAVKNNIKGSLQSLQSLNANFVLCQEVDVDGTRSYHVDEDAILQKGFADYSSTWAQNYDSPYLFYPLNSPHGKNKSGLSTFSQFQIQQAMRRSLPIETGLSKFIDLDRCYSKQEIQTKNGKSLIIYNVHLSAYTTNASTSNKQLIQLCKDMNQEAKKGNYVIAGGDFNKSLIANSKEVFKNKKVDDWAKAIDQNLISDSLRLIAPYDQDNPLPSCRNADAPYDAKNASVYLIDGFIVSDNVQVQQAKVKDNQFKYSDHNPVYMDFSLSE